jgi:hypothetical protein
MKQHFAGVVSVALVCLLAVAAFAADSPLKDWRSADFKDLVTLAKDLDAKGEARTKDLAELVSVLPARYTSDKAMLRIDWDVWAEMLGLVGGRLPAEAQATLADDMTKAVKLDAAASIAALPDDRLLNYAAALSSLGRGDAARALCAAWVNGSEKYKNASPDALRVLASYVAPSAKDLDAARGRIADHLAAKYLSDKAAARSVGGRNWLALSNDVGRSLPDDKRAQWAARLHEAYLSDAQVLASTKAEDMASVGDALGALGDKALPAFYSAWVQGSTSWQSAKPPTLGSAVEGLTGGGEAGKALKPRVAAHVTKTFLASPEAVRSVRCWDWARFADHLKGNLSPETRELWIGKLRTALLDPANLAAADPDFINLRGALENLGDKDAPSAMAAWVRGGTGWQKADGYALASLGDALVKGGEATKAEREQLVAVLGKRLASADETRKWAPAGWQTVCGTLARSMTPETRTAWIERLRAAYGDPKMMVAFKGTDILDLRGALDALGDKGSLSVETAWMNSGATGWQTMDAAALARFLQDLGKAGDAASGPDATRSVWTGEWQSLAATFAPDLDEAGRQQLRRWLGHRAGPLLLCPGILG